MTQRFAVARPRDGIAAAISCIDYRVTGASHQADPELAEVRGVLAVVATSCLATDNKLLLLGSVVCINGVRYYRLLL